MLLAFILLGSMVMLPSASADTTAEILPGIFGPPPAVGNNFTVGSNTFDTTGSNVSIVSYSTFTATQTIAINELDARIACPAPVGFSCAAGQDIRMGIYDAGGSLLRTCSAAMPGYWQDWISRRSQCRLNRSLSITQDATYSIAELFNQPGEFYMGTGVASGSRVDCNYTSGVSTPPSTLPAATDPGCSTQSGALTVGGYNSNQQQNVPLGNTSEGSDDQTDINPGDMVLYPFIAQIPLASVDQLYGTPAVSSLSWLSYVSNGFTYGIGIYDSTQLFSGGPNRLIAQCNGENDDGVVPLEAIIGWQSCYILGGQDLAMQDGRQYWLALINNNGPGKTLDLVAHTRTESPDTSPGLLATGWGIGVTGADSESGGMPRQWTTSGHSVTQTSNTLPAMYAAGILNDALLIAPSRFSQPLVPSTVTTILGDPRAEPNQISITSSTYRNTAWPYNASSSGSVDRLWLYTANPSSSPNYSSFLLLGLFDDDGGAPHNEISSCEISSVPQFPDSDPHWVSCLTTAPVPITQGRQYWLDVAAGGNSHYNVRAATTSPNVADSGDSITAGNPWNSQTALNTATEPGQVSFFADNDGRSFNIYTGTWSGTAESSTTIGTTGGGNANSAGPPGTSVTCNTGAPTNCISVGSASNMPKMVGWSYNAVNNNSYDIPIDIFFTWRTATGTGSAHTGPWGIVVPHNSSTNGSCPSSSNNNCSTTYKQIPFAVPNPTTTAEYAVDIYVPGGFTYGNVTVDLTLTWVY